MISYNSVNEINQPERGRECVTIGRLAPDFVGLSTMGYVRLSDYRGKWVILVSNPSAFGAVSTTELIDAAITYPEILERNAYIIGLTTDNIFANLAWVYDIYQNTGISIPFPVIADSDLSISELYGMLNPHRISGESVRDSFIVDPTGKIRAIFTLPVSTGRNTDELIRVFDSIRIKYNYNLNTPARWNPGDPVLLPSTTSYEEILNRVNNKEALGLNCPLWYVCYTNIPTGNVDTTLPPEVNNNAPPEVSNNTAST